MIHINDAIVGDNASHFHFGILRLGLNRLFLDVNLIRSGELIDLARLSFVAKEQLLVLDLLQVLVLLLFDRLHFLFRDAEQDAHVLQLLFIHDVHPNLPFKIFLFLLEVLEKSLFLWVWFVIFVSTVVFVHRLGGIDMLLHVLVKSAVDDFGLSFLAAFQERIVGGSVLLGNHVTLRLLLDAPLRLSKTGSKEYHFILSWCLL